MTKNLMKWIDGRMLNFFGYFIALIEGFANAVEIFLHWWAEEGDAEKTVDTQGSEQGFPFGWMPDYLVLLRSPVASKGIIKSSPLIFFAAFFGRAVGTIITGEYHQAFLSLWVSSLFILPGFMFCYAMRALELRLEKIGNS